MSGKSSSNGVGEVLRVMLSLFERPSRSSLSMLPMFPVSRSWERSMSISLSEGDASFMSAIVSIQRGAGEWGSKEVMVK